MVKIIGQQNIRNKTESMVNVATTVMLNSVLLVDLIRMLVHSDVIVALFQYALYFIVAIYVYYRILFIKRLKVPLTFFIYSCYIVVVLIASCLINKQILLFYDFYVPFVLLRAIPCMYLCYETGLNDYSNLNHLLYKFRYIWLAYAIVGSIYVPINTNWNQYSITFGYNLVLAAGIVFNNFMRFKQPKDLVLIIIYLLSIMLYASRGSLLCIAVLMVIIYFLNYDKSAVSVVRFIVALTTFIIVAVNISPILAFLYNHFPNSRTLRMLASGNMSDSGRTILHSYISNEIQESRFSIRGIFSDRIFYSNSLNMPIDITNHPHNFPLEVLYQFGCILGGLLLLYILILSIYAAYCQLSIGLKDVSLFWAYYFVSGFIKLWFSASYLTIMEFYFFISLSTIIIVKTRRSKGWLTDASSLFS